MAELAHQLVKTDGETRLTVEGEIDLSNSRDLRAVILAALADTRALAVDLSAVRYIDSSGVANLIEGFQKAKAQKKSFKVVDPSEPVRMVLRMARLETILLG